VSGNASQPATMTNMTVATYAVDVGVGMLYIPLQEGFFKQEGLNVTLVPGSASLTSLIVSGRAQLGLIGGASAMNVAAEGQNLQIIAQTAIGYTAASVFSSKQVNSITQCKRFGSLEPGSSSYGAAVLWKKHGNYNYTIVSFDNDALMESALASGSIDCFSASADGLGPAVQAGVVKELISSLDPKVISELGGASGNAAPDGSLFGLASTLQSHKQNIVAFLKAMNMGYQWIHSHSVAQIAAVLKTNPDFKSYSLSNLEANTTIWLKTLPTTSPIGYISADTWPHTLSYWANFGLPHIDPSSPDLTYDKRVDMSYLQAAQ
jgi:ABC-type nitrate/sulfonate/bicarbonate transport system substrate-binding protein